MNGPAMAGILTVLHALVDIKNTVLDRYHYLLFYLATAINPRSLVTLLVEEGQGEAGEGEGEVVAPVSVKASVRVGLAVETVGQAGRPKTITGFQVCANTCSCQLI